MTELKPYPKYKDSGVEWIGEIPENWNVTKVGYAFNITLGKMIQTTMKNETDVLVPYLKANNVQDSYINYDTIDEMYATLTDINTYKLEINDLLVCEGGEVARSAFVEKPLENFIFQNALHRVRGSQIGDIRYLHYLLNTIRHSGYIDLLVNKATIAHFTKDKFSSLRIPLPNINEQKSIAEYLYNHTSKIDSLIADKERLIKLLEEKRQAVITETVTKGLDPNVKMKKSGIEWIGEIPEHWNVTKIKYESKINERTLSDNTDPDKEISYIDIGSVDSNGNILEKEIYKFKNAPSRARRIVKKGDTIVSTVRTYLKAITMIDDDSDGCIVSTGFAVLSPKETTVKEYFGLYFRSTTVLDRIVSISKGINYPAINSSDLAQLEFIFPPYEEQLEIVQKINKKLKEIEIIIKEIKYQITKLQEYRESLIYEAITGKIDLRDYSLENEQIDLNDIEKVAELNETYQ